LGRWLVLAAIGALVLLGPLVFADQIEQIANTAADKARHHPMMVASLIVAALALDVFLPVPNGVTNTLAGAIFGFAGGMAVIWIGLMAASLLGYGVGAMAARPLARRLLGEQELERAHRFAAGFGPLLLILSRPVPVLAELASLAAGMSAMPLRLFLLLTGLANLAVAFVYAGIGAAAMSTNSVGLAMLGAVILPLCAWLTYRWWLGRLS
jgi:uncharacterized membrane protein YdjX (TVP38/TMEM64 family)